MAREVFSRLQPATCSCLRIFRGSDGHDLLPIILDVLSAWSFEPFSIWEHAPRHHVLRSRVDDNGDFSPRPRSSSIVSWDQMIQSSRHLVILVILHKVVKCWSWVRFASTNLPRHKVPPSSRVLLPLLLQVHFPTRLGPLLRLCCWSNCMDNSH